MYSCYKLNILPIILNRFKVNKVILCGLSDGEMLNQIWEYCNVNDSSYTAIDLENNFEFESINDDNVLDVLHDLMDYDAIFLDGDPNWYTVYNELNIINRNNKAFPLVFICNNIFPHKRKDSYKDPNIIPKEFRNEFSKEFEVGNIILEDNFYHAIDENTPKNGVLTAIEDFLNENVSIGLMDIKFLNGLTILYPESSISQIRLSKLHEEIEGYRLNDDEIQENIVKNNYLESNILKNNKLVNCDFKNELDKKEKIIKDYENKIQIHDDEVNYKNSQIDNVTSELNLKEAQIKNIESQIFNHENEVNSLMEDINSLKNELTQNESKYERDISEAYTKIDLLKNNLSLREKNELELKSKLQNANNQIQINVELLTDKDKDINLKNYQIKNMEKELDNKNLALNSIKHSYTSQLSKVDTNEYCISCYKEEINNNMSEIQYLKKYFFTRKLFGPLAYVYLIFKSNPRELFINFKLYKAIKNSKCFDVGYYLANNNDIQESKWCKFFSPELHYVCNGFDERRTFNKKYFNRHSKKELLDYIMNCP